MNRSPLGKIDASCDPTPAPDSLALSAKQITSGFLPVSLANWRRADAAGKIPAGVRMLGRKVWRRSDLERWIAMGCPDRQTFEQTNHG